MRVDKFSARIPEGIEIDNGQVGLAHDTPYSVVLGNHSTRRCDAVLSIDGKEIQTFRLHGWETMTIEGPPGDGGRFTFYRANSGAGVAAESYAVDLADRGLLTVRFRPEKPKPVRPRAMYLASKGFDPNTDTIRPRGGVSRGAGGQMCSAGTPEIDLSDAEAGVTGLSGHTDQKWNTADPIDHDPDYEVVISLRLVATEQAPKPGPRPLRAAVVKANPVPPVARG